MATVSLPTPAMSREQLRHVIDNLDDFERGILESAAAGETDQAIATRLGVCRRTVQLHRKSLRGTLQANCRADLIRAAAVAGQPEGGAA